MCTHDRAYGVPILNVFEHPDKLLILCCQSAANRATLQSLFEADSSSIHREPAANKTPISDWASIML